jgi:kynureninase
LLGSGLAYRDEFVLPAGVVAYLDGNSLGRPLRVTADRLRSFVDGEWGDRLIRSWDERWMERPLELGDLIGRVVLGAGPGQTVVADSTTVLLYKVIRAAVAAQPDRREIVADTENFPTDRFLVETIARELGLTVRWISPDPGAGVRLSEVRPSSPPPPLWWCSVTWPTSPPTSPTSRASPRPPTGWGR